MKIAAINGVGFNAEWVKTKSFEEFCEHEKHHGLSKADMKHIWEYCTGKKVKGKKQADVQPGESEEFNNQG